MTLAEAEWSSICMIPPPPPQLLMMEILGFCRSTQIRKRRDQTQNSRLNSTATNTIQVITTIGRAYSTIAK